METEREKGGEGAGEKPQISQRESEQVSQLLELNRYLLAERAALEQKLKLAEEFVLAVRGVNKFDDVEALYHHAGAPEFFDAVYQRVMEEFYTALKCTTTYDAYESDGPLEDAIAYEVTSLLKAAGVMDEDHELLIPKSLPSSSHKSHAAKSTGNTTHNE